jgi:hypothetical protein
MVMATLALQGSGKPCNSTRPEVVRLPEADISDTEYFIEQVRLMLPVLATSLVLKQRLLR